MFSLIAPSCRTAHDDAARVEIVVECLALAQKLGREDHVVRVELLADVFRVAHGNGALYHHDGPWVYSLHLFNHFLHVRRVKVILYRVIVGGSGDYHEVRVLVCAFSVSSGCQMQFLFRQIFFDIFILNRRFPPVDHVHLFRNHVHRSHLVVLAQQGCDAEAHIARSGYGYFQVFKVFHIIGLF